MFNEVKKNGDIALSLGIDPYRLSQLSDRHYCIWLLRNILAYADAPTMVKQECLKLCYDLINSYGKKLYGGIDYLWINHPWTMSNWLRAFHDQYFKHSKFYMEEPNE